eukprot:GHRQ01025029.1.p2 GENE.GHRQ01025029.1~~GHRQ01025029.1.p2  ORF type:complete len:120 (-),score=4.40 GHRQ01025029.1:181-540(-)
MSGKPGLRMIPLGSGSNTFLCLCRIFCSRSRGRTASCDTDSASVTSAAAQRARDSSACCTTTMNNSVPAFLASLLSCVAVTRPPFLGNSPPPGVLPATGSAAAACNTCGEARACRIMVL